MHEHIRHSFCNVFSLYTRAITQPGSYRLSSNLIVPGALPIGPNGIDIWTSNVTLDLNGFSIIGPFVPNDVVADPGDAIAFRFVFAGPANGISVVGENIEVRNGTVRGFTTHGLFFINSGCLDCNDAEGNRVIGVRAVRNGRHGMNIETQATLVDGCTADRNGTLGFRLESGGLVINSVARANGGAGFGFSATTSSGFRSNVSTHNNGGDANPQVLREVNLGANLCGAALCP